jgi:hypothetical protein
MIAMIRDFFWGRSAAGGEIHPIDLSARRLRLPNFAVNREQLSAIRSHSPGLQCEMAIDGVHGQPNNGGSNPDARQSSPNHGASIGDSD